MALIEFGVSVVGKRSHIEVDRWFTFRGSILVLYSPNAFSIDPPRSRIK